MGLQPAEVKPLKLHQAPQGRDGEGEQQKVEGVMAGFQHQSFRWVRAQAIREGRPNEPQQRRAGEQKDQQAAPGGGHKSVELAQVHAGVEPGDLVCIAVKQLRGNDIGSQ